MSSAPRQEKYPVEIEGFCDEFREDSERSRYFCCGAWAATAIWFAAAKATGLLDWNWFVALWPITFPFIGMCGATAFVVLSAAVSSAVDWISSKLRKD